MYQNDYDLWVLNAYRIEDLRRGAERTRQLDRPPPVRIAVAHALVAIANRVWHEEPLPAESAPRSVALG